MNQKKQRKEIKPNNVETWVISDKTGFSEKFDLSGQIMGIFPIIKSLHERFPTDILHLDLQRIHLLFDENGKVISERLIIDKNPFWHAKNPFPINSIDSDQEILSIWDRKVPGTANFIFTQLGDDIQKLIDIKNKDSNTVLLVCQFMRIFSGVAVECCNCYMIKMQMINGTLQCFLTNDSRDSI
ncbi:MAG TPA: hypothetical protein VN704_00985 [Verrucomicrobiae bacterium]|nr:hypothetical protein [Verrucomicrobiae bacterium]